MLTDPFLDERLLGDDAPDLVVVDSDDPNLPLPGSLPLVVLALSATDAARGPAWADAVVDGAGARLIADRVAATPLTATTLAVHLRVVASLNVDDGLAVESATYSLLQAGPEFARWRSTDRHRHHDDAGDRVRMERDDGRLSIVLQRGGHNAIDARLRDELAAAFAVALADDSIDAVVVRADGRSFSSGGDLGEMGQRSDVASAHRIRLARSLARSAHRLSDRTTAQVHGATLGGGLELAAFAGHVVAHPDTTFGLPELNLGLIPGAGGTVSVTRRIGRQRTAHLVFSDSRIDADTALDWGLVDEIAEIAAAAPGDVSGREV